MQRYLVTTNTDYPDFLEGIFGEPFLTDSFDAENNFLPAAKMVVYDLHKSTYTTDGTTWQLLSEDHL